MAPPHSWSLAAMLTVFSIAQAYSAEANGETMTYDTEVKLGCYKISFTLP